MEWNVYKVENELDVKEDFYKMLASDSYHSLSYGALKPLYFDEVLHSLNARDILRSDMHITPLVIEYKNALSERVDRIETSKEGIKYVGNDLDSPLVYLLYRHGRLYFEQTAITNL